MDQIDLIREFIVKRLDRIENKVDMLIEFRWKFAGSLVIIAVLVQAAIQLIPKFMG